MDELMQKIGAVVTDKWPGDSLLHEIPTYYHSELDCYFSQYALVYPENQAPLLDQIWVYNYDSEVRFNFKITMEFLKHADNSINLLKEHIQELKKATHP